MPIRALSAGNGELLATRAKLRDVQISSAVSLALMKAKATPTGAELLAEHLAKRVTIETVDGRDTFRIAGADGKPMSGSNSDGLANFGDLIGETIKKIGELFEGQGLGGGGASQRGGRNTLGPKTMLRREFDGLNGDDRAARMKSGWKIVDG